MPRSWALVLSALFVPTAGLTQDFAAHMTRAQQQIEARQWEAALDLLLGLKVTAKGENELQQLAKKLSDVGYAARDVAAFGFSLRAHEAALAIRRLTHGNDDHPDVARSLNALARSLQLVGRDNEALPQFEASLAMYRQCYGEDDHPTLVLGLNNVGTCLQALGRSNEALRQYEAALAMSKRLHEDDDDPLVAATLNNLAQCMQTLGRLDDALPQLEESLAMHKRLYGDGDHPVVATGMNNVAACLHMLGRFDEALRQYEAALAMHTRLNEGRDHPEVARARSNVAHCLKSLGRSDTALPLFESCLAMEKRLYGEANHSDVAQSINNLASCVHELGRSGAALAGFTDALAMYRRIYADRDHPDVAMTLDNLADCLRSLGRSGEALPQSEAALAMRQRLYGDRDHPDVAASINSVATCLESLGRSGEALPQYEAALAMRKRLYAGRDHADVARAINNVATCLQLLERFGEALPECESGLAMARRVYGKPDHPQVAIMLSNLANCLRSLGRLDEALPHFKEALAMDRRVHGVVDHPTVASSLHNLAAGLSSLGQRESALLQYEAALAMTNRLYGATDHPDLVASLSNLADCLQSLGRWDEALRHCQRAAAMIERLRETSRTSATLRQSLFDHLKRADTFEQLQSLTIQLGQVADSLHAAERGRGRELLDLLEQHAFDAFAEATQRAEVRGDDGVARRLPALRQELQMADLESDRLIHQMTRLDEGPLVATERAARREELLARSNAATTRHRQLLDERARLLGDVLPVGQVRTVPEIQAALRDGELLLEFTITKDASFLYVLARESAVEALPLPAAHATIQRLLPGLLARTSHAQLAETRGRDPEKAPAATPAEASAPARELFASLIPDVLWPRIRAARRVFVAAHRDLHRLPFELLVTAVKDGKPVFWLDEGPAISYVPSGSAMHWLRQRAKKASDDATGLDLLAVGDPGELAIEPELPEQGVFLLSVNADGEGARRGLRPRDVLLRYDGRPLVDDQSLGELRSTLEAEIASGKRPDTLIPLEVWRRGELLRIDVPKGRLGIEVGPGKARDAWEASLGGDAQLARITRHGDLERLRKLLPLRGALLETQAIEAVFASKKKKTRRLTGAAATEPAIVTLAGTAKYLHFACHGIAEEYAGQSLSMLVLSQPKDVVAGDDGLLDLGDLLQRWRARLSSCRLVVLSACRTNVGPTLRDEAPQALPIGFLFAGAPSVISSLWAVDDESTRILMTDFYQRLLAGETDRLKAFTEARRALRQRYPDPFHWAPFLFIGSPE